MDGLLYTTLSFVPILFYMVIIFLTTPTNFNIKMFSNYFFFGIISIGFLLIFYRIFPNFQDQIELPFVIFDKNVDSGLLFFFFQVGFLEETMKYLGFITCKNIDGRKITPMDIMIYSGITALGFSFVENCFYAIETGGESIVSRMVTATLLHMMCGFISGYFISLGLIKEKYGGNTIFSHMMYKYPKIKPILYTILGLISASFLHGIYDYNIFYTTSSASIVILIMIIFLGFAVCYTLSRNLMTTTRDLGSQKM